MFTLTEKAFSQVLPPNDLSVILMEIENNPDFGFSSVNLEALTQILKNFLEFDTDYFKERYECLYNLATSDGHVNSKGLWTQFKQMLDACLCYFNQAEFYNSEMAPGIAANIVAAFGTDSMDAQCFEGAYKRLREIFLCNNATTINASLEILRQSIVKKCAYIAIEEGRNTCLLEEDFNNLDLINSSEIHIHNYFYLKASSKFGVRPILKNTIYGGYFTDEEVLNYLETSFTNEYTSLYMTKNSCHSREGGKPSLKTIHWPNLTTEGYFAQSGLFSIDDSIF